MNSIQTPEAAAAQQQEEKFDVKKALNNGKFQKFLAKFPDAIDAVHDPEELEKRFQSLETIDEVGGRLKKVFAEKIGGEFGLKLDKADLDTVDSYLQDLAIEGLDNLKQIEGELVVFERMPEEISNAEQMVAGLMAERNQDAGALAEQLAESRENLGVLKNGEKSVGFMAGLKYKMETVFNMGKKLAIQHRAFDASDKTIEETWGKSEELRAQKESVNAMKEKFGELGTKEYESLLASTEADISTAEAELQRHSEVVRKIDELGALRESSLNIYKQAQEGLFGRLTQVAGLTEAIQKKIDDQFAKMMQGRQTVVSLEKVQQRLNELQKMAEKTETGIDPLELVKQNQGNLQDTIDDTLELMVREEIDNALKKVRVGDNALTRLEQSLTPLLQRARMGSKEDQDLKDFIANALEDSANQLGNTPEDNVKRMLIARINPKFQNKEAIDGLKAIKKSESKTKEKIDLAEVRAKLDNN
jgi:hypothetical protein